VPIQKAYLLSCVNARFEDLHDAAEVIRARGGRVADGVEFSLAPASAEVQARSESNGDWQTLLGAGAIALPPGFGACIGLGRGLVLSVVFLFFFSFNSCVFLLYFFYF